MPTIQIDLPSLDAAIHHLYNRRATRDAELHYIPYSLWPWEHQAARLKAPIPVFPTPNQTGNPPGSPTATHLGGHRT